MKGLEVGQAGSGGVTAKVAATASAPHLQQPLCAADTQLIVGIVCTAAAQQQIPRLASGTLLLEYRSLKPIMHSYAMLCMLLCMLLYTLLCMLLCICVSDSSRPDPVSYTTWCSQMRDSNA